MAKRKKNRLLSLLLLLLVVAGGLYAFLYSRETPPQAKTERYTVEKSGAGATADFTAASREIHAAVDKYLSSAGMSVKDKDEMRREVPRSSVEGNIRWHARSLLLNASADLAGEKFRTGLAGALQGVKGEIIAVQTDSFRGVPATRFDVGFKDVLAGETVTIITDKIYLPKDKRSDAAAVPEKQEVPMKGRIAFVIDDFGYSREPIAAYAAISRPLTFSVLPYRQYSNEAAAAGLSSGHEVMVHLPMEPLASSEQSEKITITVDLSDAQIRDITSKAIQAVPGAIGINNHQGSRATGDRRVMKAVLGVIKDNGMFFVDSRTSSQSVAYDTARQLGLRTGENNLFIDNSSEISAIKGQIRAAAQTALTHGSVTVIGHARMNTAAAIKEMIPELEGEGIRLVFESQLVH